MRRRPGRAGFTLIEVLVSLAISGLVMASVLGSLDYTQRAVDAIHNVIETETAGPRLMALIREDLEALAVYDAAEFRVLKGESRTIAGADADSLDFIAYRRSTRSFQDPTRLRPVNAPLVEIGYRCRQSPASPDFLELYRREDFLQDDKPFEDGQFSLLYDRLVNLEILYYEKPEYDPVWEDDWDSAEMEALPYAIEVRLEIEIQPRRSAESLGILGSNRSRLSFTDMFTIPETTRWVFRNRLHPLLPTPGEAESLGTGAGPGDPAAPGPGVGGPPGGPGRPGGGGDGRGLEGFGDGRGVSGSGGGGGGRGGGG
ncbi:MAG: prepilin-type N-terminal cleavage/methylation domain-containing protein [Planctomycetes bacterium]|nr:prepilin-type N-terminal cleavage/methylation domain-containing protein [Planctomycetota bacterium]MBL7008118.1 prepilin-type N-terminal cleavage/methylation domain-containing protein [Planctomycetota bacterium]